MKNQNQVHVSSSKNTAGRQSAKTRSADPAPAQKETPYRLDCSWSEFSLATNLARKASMAAGLLRSMSDELFHLYQLAPGCDEAYQHNNEDMEAVAKVADDLEYLARNKIGDAMNRLVDAGVREYRK